MVGHPVRFLRPDSTAPAGVAAREVPRRPLLGRAHRDPRELRGGGRPHAVLRRQEEELNLLPAVHANLQSGPPRGPTFCPHPQIGLQAQKQELFHRNLKERVPTTCPYLVHPIRIAILLH